MNNEQITTTRPTKHVYYSLTEKNPYLDPSYYESLLHDLDEKMADRMLRGKWLTIKGEVVYYTYDESINFLRDKKFKLNLDYPIRICWDFNIGDGKPLSVVLMQYNKNDDRFDCYEEVIVEGIRTETACEELGARGLLEPNTKIIVHGDATGKARSTNSKKTNYDIIKEFLANFTCEDGRKLDYEIQVGLSNPPIRKRHMKLRGYCKNANGQHRLFVWGPCKILNRGMKLTKLKKGGQFVEDDSKEYQHCTTALGYGVVETIKRRDWQPQGTRFL